MNERIEKLAEQAKFMAEEDINRQISYNTELKAFAEKFAELLVKECAKFLDENSGSDQCNNVWYPEPEDMLKHFGVEE